MDEGFMAHGEKTLKYNVPPIQLMNKAVYSNNVKYGAITWMFRQTYYNYSNGCIFWLFLFCFCNAIILIQFVIK